MSSIKTAAREFTADDTVLKQRILLKLEKETKGDDSIIIMHCVYIVTMKFQGNQKFES